MMKKILFLMTIALLLGCSKGETPDPISTKVIPTVSTTAATSITQNNATSGGNITSDGGATVTSRGVCWGANNNPTTSDNKTSDGLGIGGFSSSITGLIPNTTYYVRAYATNSIGTAYGNEINFKTTIVSLGDSYQGGKIFFIDGTGNHGLIAATTDVVYSGNNTFYWGSGNNLIGASDIYKGKPNTLKMASELSSICAGYAFKNGYVLNGYSDWYIPAQEQLIILKENRDYVGGFSTISNSAGYWSSTELSFDKAFALNFVALMGTTVTKYGLYAYRIRPIRDF